MSQSEKRPARPSYAGNREGYVGLPRADRDTERERALPTGPPRQQQSGLAARGVQVHQPGRHGRSGSNSKSMRLAVHWDLLQPCGVAVHWGRLGGALCCPVGAGASRACRCCGGTSPTGRRQAGQSRAPGVRRAPARDEPGLQRGCTCVPSTCSVPEARKSRISEHDIPANCEKFVRPHPCGLRSQQVNCDLARRVIRSPGCR
jgi:hypothetical protein